MTWSRRPKPVRSAPGTIFATFTAATASAVVICAGVSPCWIVWGTFGALAQAANIRRMLAYSAITHAGFIGLALGSGPDGPLTAAFYAAIYASMAMLVFAALYRLVHSRVGNLFLSLQQNEELAGCGPLLRRIARWTRRRRLLLPHRCDTCLPRNSIPR